MIYENSKSIKRVADIVRQFLRVMGAEGRPDRSSGEYILDQELQRDDGKISSPGLARLVWFPSKFHQIFRPWRFFQK